MIILLVLFVILVGYLLWRRDDCTVLQTINLGAARVEIVNDACKEGLPHTTGPHTIRMTREVWDGPRRDVILAHERIHLAQKCPRRGAAWRDFYARAWDFMCSVDPPRGVPAELVARLRPNPDTSDAPWAVWRRRWLFFPAFGAEGSLRDAEIIVWDLENHRQVNIPDEWRAEFCGDGGMCPNQYEHPHEISAEWLAAPTGSVKSSAASKLFAWYK